MSDSHPCLMPTCERMAHSRWAICGECYRALPSEHRAAISRAFAPGMTEETMSLGLRRALNEARAWVLAAFGDVARDKYDPGKWERLKRYVREKDEARARARGCSPRHAFKESK